MLDSVSTTTPASATDDYRWLTSPAAASLLATLAASPQSLVAQATALRRQFSPARTHLLLEQLALRPRALAKFSAADRMYFTSLGLEQASDEIVAAHKARRFAAGTRAFDLCSGIGGDLVALAGVCEATGFDRDPTMAVLAEANGRVVAEASAASTGIRSPTVHVRDVEHVDVGECDAWHIDPDRRPRGRRTTRVELHEPGIQVMEALLARNASAAIKLAPAATLPVRWADQSELEWISRGGECRQLVAWFGSLAQAAGQRRATIVGRTTTRTILGVASEDGPPVSAMDSYVFEPDAAVLAAHLGPTLAAEHRLAAIAAGSVYWSGPQPILDPALACFEVLEVLPFRLKPLAAWLRARNIGTLEIKKRGVDHDPHKLREQLKPAGDASATLIVTRLGKREIAIVVKRVASGQ